MSGKPDPGIKIRFYEYLIYWPISAVILLLALPILLFRFFHFLFRATGAPLKSAGNLVGFLLVVGILSNGYITFELFDSLDFTNEIRSVMVNKDDRFSTIAANLRRSGVIRGEYLFRAAAIIMGADKRIVPGRYDFTGETSMYDVIIKLKTHDIALMRLTITEGSTVYRIASLLAQFLKIDSTSFVNRTVDTAFTREKYRVDGLEGYLFPETYQFWYGITIDEIIQMMVDQFQKKTARLFDSLPPDIKSPKELLILASIIQAEAGFEGEMTLISSVYHNRLREGMLLQADPTVIYALSRGDRSLSYDDLKYDSPYNTYTYSGLPPGPINSPGLAAIKAALHPAETGFLYFVATGEGKHIFSRTLEEHNWARQKIKAIKKSQGSN